MRYFKFKISSELNNTLDKILSSILPHSNFNVGEASGVIEELFKTLPLEEAYGTYYVFLKILQRLSIARLYIAGYDTSLRREIFDSALQASIDSIVASSEFDAETFFKAYDLSYNLDVDKERYEASSFAYSELLAKYDELFEMQIPSAEGMTWINIFKQDMERDITAKMISCAGQALTQGIACDREFFKGAEKARQFLSMALTDVNTRIANTFSDLTSRFTPTTITSYNQARMYDERNAAQLRSLYYTGVEPLDTVHMICTQDIWNVVADEGVGKTRFALDQTYKALMSGVNVLYICGETPVLKVKKAIEGTHLFSKYGLQLSYAELTDYSKIEVSSLDKLDDIVAKINSSCLDLYENPGYGKLTLVQSCSYETFLEDIEKFHKSSKFDLVVVDHVLALSSTGGMTTLGRLVTKSARISYLYECEDILVKDIDVAFLNTTHPSVNTSADLKAGKRPGARSGAESSDSSKYASLITVLHNDDSLRNQDMVTMYVTKNRDAPPVTEPIVLRRHGYTNIHEFDPKIQYLAQGKSDALDVSDLADLLGFEADES